MKEHDNPGTKKERFIVRFPDGMRDRIAELARENGRSMNSEIIQRLEDSLTREESADYATGEDRPTRDEVLNLMLHGLSAGLDAFERARDQGASSADMHRAMKDAIIEACKGQT